MTNLPPIKNPTTQLKSERVYENRYIKFYKDWVRLDDGHEREYVYTDTNAGVNILTLDENNCITLVGQWRYAIQRGSWELPAGFLEKGEDPLESAKRELAEEAALEAKSWEKLEVLYMEVSLSTHKSHLFLARDLVKLPSQNLDEDERIQIVTLPLEEAFELVQKGEIIDAVTIYAILRARDYLQNLE